MCAQSSLRLMSLAGQAESVRRTEVLILRNQLAPLPAHKGGAVHGSTGETQQAV